MKIIDLLKKYREIITYLIVGMMTTAVSWGVYAILRVVIDISNPFLMQVAVVSRWVAGVLFAYFANRIFVFRSHDPKIFTEMLKFSASRVMTLFVDVFVMWFFPTILKFNDWIATFISAVLVTVLNYVFSKLLVFKNGKNEKIEERSVL